MTVILPGRTFVVRRFIRLQSDIFKGLWSTCLTSDLKAPTCKRGTASLNLKTSLG